MKRLLLWIVLLTMLFSGGIALAARAGRDAPLPAFAQWFTYPDGKPCPMPCLFGIQINVTKWDDAAAILQQHPAIRVTRTFAYNPERSFIAFFLEGKYNVKERLELSVEGNKNGLVHEMFLILVEDGRKSFYEMVSVWGAPEGVWLFPFENATQYNYLKDSIRLAIDEVKDSCQIDLDNRVDMIIMRSQGYLKSHFVGDEIFYPWSGLAKGVYWEKYYKHVEYGVSPYECDQWRR
jgi:hypothetical protein